MSNSNSNKTSYSLYQIQEIYKCYKDPIYFIETYCWIELKGSQKIVPFKLYEYQKDIIKKLHNGESLVVLKSRRNGISWCISAYAAWCINFKKGINGLFLSKTEKDAITLLNKPKFILRNLALHDGDNLDNSTKADWLLNTIVTDNTTELSIGWLNDSGNVANKSTLKSLTTTDEAGRGEDASIIFVDEAAFIDGFDNVIGSILPTTQGGGIFIIASTPNMAAGEFYNLCMKGKMAKEDPDTYKVPYTYVEAHWTQTDVDPEVIAQLKSAMGESKARQEYELQFGQSGEAVFSEEYLNAVYKPLDYYPELQEYLDNYRKNINHENRYYIGVDSAFGKTKKNNRNYSVFIALTADGVQAYTYADRDISISEWGGYTIVEDGINKFIPGKVSQLHQEFPGDINIEKNNFGNQTFEFHVVPNDGISSKKGYLTNPSNKPFLISSLIIAVETKQIVITDKATYLELLSYQKGKTANSYSAPSGMFDDRVIALALAWDLYKANIKQDITVDVSSFSYNNTANYNTGMIVNSSYGRFEDFDLPFPEFDIPYELMN